MSNARNLERIADHAIGIAQAVVYFRKVTSFVTKSNCRPGVTELGW